MAAKAESVATSLRPLVLRILVDKSVPMYAVEPVFFKSCYKAINTCYDSTQRSTEPCCKPLRLCVLQHNLKPEHI